MLPPSPHIYLSLAATPCLLCVCLAFFRSLPVCCLAFIPSFFTLTHSSLIFKLFPLISFLSRHSFTLIQDSAQLSSPLTSTFSFIYFFLSYPQAPSFPYHHPPATISISTLQHPSFLLSTAPGVEVSLRYSRRLFEVPGALRVCVRMCVYVSRNFFFFFFYQEL